MGAVGPPEGHKVLCSVGKPGLAGMQSAKAISSLQSLQTINEDIELPKGESKGVGEPAGPTSWLESKSFTSASK
jgi:hypothetical protein